MKKARCDKPSNTGPLVVWGGNTLLELQRHIGVCEKHKAQLPEEVAMSHEQLLRVLLAKPYFKILECQAVIEKVFALPRLVYPASSEGSSKDELTI